ncbi:MAG: hypothetical protein EPO35_07945 [Acidobacteria bacterium]|nr:MAG: hypothetical protein EPO35_07945 [Acidobacteriota bacterium]
MIAVALHEARMIGRRAIWPAVLILHAAATASFVIVWGPTGGVPLWQASLLEQLTAMDRLAAAALLTWLATAVLTDDGARRLADWSALAGLPTATVFRARITALVTLSLVFIAVAAPAFVAAGEISAATPRDIARHIGMSLGFSALAAGVTAAASVALRDRVGVWCTAMAVCLIAALGVRMLPTDLMRMLAPAIAGLIMLAAVPSMLRSRRVTDGD